MRVAAFAFSKLRVMIKVVLPRHLQSNKIVVIGILTPRHLSQIWQYNIWLLSREHSRNLKFELSDAKGALLHVRSHGNVLLLQALSRSLTGRVLIA